MNITHDNEAASFTGYRFYKTEVKAVDPEDGTVKIFPGPRVRAKSKSHAIDILTAQNLAYFTIIEP